MCIRDSYWCDAYVDVNMPAPAGGWVVDLTSSNSSWASLPSTVTIAAGATEAEFDITGGPVADLELPVITATIPTAANATVSKTMQVYSPFITGLSVSPTSVVG